MTELTAHRHRLAGTALVVGGMLTISGYVLSGTLLGSNEDERFTNSLWAPLYSIALVGAVLTVLGLPAILAAHKGRESRLTLIGYVGVLTTIVMLNIGEGVIEAFVKPYLVTHGGIPEEAPTGLGVYFGVAFLFLLVGLVSLGVAVIRAKVFPWWVGALFIASVPLSFVGQGLPGALEEVGDYFAFVALMSIGWGVVRPARRARSLVANAEATA